MTYRVEATCDRTALLLGLIRGEEVHRWAERIIEREPSAPDGLVDLVLVSPDDLSGLRHALWPVSIEPEPLPVFRAMLGLLQSDLEAGRRGLADTITVLRQMRSMLRLPGQLYDELNATLVRHVTVATAVPDWLGTFAGNHLQLMGSSPD
jgi:hypothetical protein